jgi:hypothetical protein
MLRLAMSQPAGTKILVSGGLQALLQLSGRVAQLVEQRTENPCVGGSIPSPATIFLSISMIAS